MKILKVLNNNSVVVSDEENIESIIMGKGIAFNKKIGEKIEEKNIEKRFILDKESESIRLVQLVKEIPIEVIMLSNRIIEYGKSKLNIDMTKNIEIPLTDHINFAIERCKKGIVITSSLLWEIKRLYPDEYKVSLEIIKMINEEFKIELPKDEATFIALHFVNGQLYGNMNNTINSTHLIQDIISIVQYHFKVELDDESLNYFRFVTHLKFFVGRVMQGEMLAEKEYFLYDFMRLKYDEIFKCTLKIEKLVKTKFGFNVSEEEMSYLMVHIERVIAR